MAYYDQVKEAADAVRARIRTVPEIAIVLGSGLGDFANNLADPVVMPYDTLPHWPAARVVGHEGKLVVGSIRGKTIAALAGRCHLYEGHPAATVSFAVRTLGLLGVKLLVLTNAAGGVNTGFAQGALMIIDDHINMMGTSPLIGSNDDRFGPRFPDMSEVYSARLRDIADEAARTRGVPVSHGVYIAVQGPSYETPAEINFFRKMGADAIGMSTVPEAIAARHMGMEVLGISCITNAAAAVGHQPIVHDDVIATGRRVRRSFIALLEGIIERL